MRIKLYNVILIFFCLVLFVVIGCNGSDKQTTINENGHYVDSTVSRQKQIEKCATCHKSEYDNWKIGPHANAMLMLDKHNNIPEKDSSFPKGYINFVHERVNTVCASCHTGQNSYDVNFKGINHLIEVSKLNKDSFPEFLKQAYTRNNSKGNEIETGVDCMTCHAQGNKVVTNFNSKANKKNGIIKSHLFSNNMNCYSCHHHQVSTMQDLVKEGKLKNEISCVSCHQQYNDDGVGQHYFYWKHNDVTKERPERLDIFSTAKLIVEKKQLLFSWKNTMMPHGFSECGEALCTVIATYGNDKTDTLYEVKINRKDYFDQQKNYPNHFLIGENGLPFTYSDEIKQSIKIDKKSTLKYITIIGLFKPQYWSSSKEYKIIYEKRYTEDAINALN